MSASVSNGLNKKYWIKLAICFIVPILMLFLPTNEFFTPEIRKYLAVTLFGIIMFIFEVAPGPIVALTLASSYAIFSVVSLDVVLSSWSHSIVWQGFLCLLILEGVNSTPLMRRICAVLVIRMGGSYLGVMMGLAIVSLIIGVLIPNNGTTLLLVGMGYGLCQSLKLKPGDAAAVGIMMICGLGICEAQNSFFSTAGIGASAAMVSTTVPGFSIGYMEIILDNLIFIPFLFIMTFIFVKIYKPDRPISGADYFRAQLEQIGPVQAKEKRVIAILLAMVLYLFTSQWHGLNMAYGFAVAVILLFFPATNIATIQDFKRVDMGFPILVASCMAIGNVGTAVGAGAAGSSLIIPILESANSPFVFIAITWVCGILANVLMTPMALFTLIAPIMGPIADSLGYSPKIVAYILYHTGNNVFFPYENNTILMMYGFGMMRMGQFCKGAIIKMVLDCIFVLGLGTVYWSLLGLL